MVNLDLLQEEINAANMPPTALAAAWGVSMQTYYNLKSGKSEFTAARITAVVKSLNLSKAKRDAIFFAE